MNTRKGEADGPQSQDQFLSDWFATPEGQREFTEWARGRNGYTAEEFDAWVDGNVQFTAYSWQRLLRELEEMKRKGLVYEGTDGRIRLTEKGSACVPLKEEL